MISLRGLTRKFGGLTAVDHLSLEVEKGEIVGLVGPDGAGKTTTLRLIVGLADATEGTASVAGFDVAKDPIAVRDRIGYMAQRFGLYGDLTVGENMRFYADLFGMSAADRDGLTPELLEMTRMKPFVDRPAAKLSGGMKQKLALMCTLLHKPQVLLLDEPTNGVDPVSRRDFWVILHRLVSEGLTLLLTTAYMDEAERCGRVCLMHEGRLLACDTPENLRHSIPDDCYSVQVSDPRAERARLAKLPQVRSARPAGSSLHVFLRKDTPPDEVWGKLQHQPPPAPVVGPGGASFSLRRTSVRLPEDPYAASNSSSPPGASDDLAAGFNPPKVDRTTPSLEDVFVTTIEGA